MVMALEATEENKIQAESGVKRQGYKKHSV